MQTRTFALAALALSFPLGALAADTTPAQAIAAIESAMSLDGSTTVWTVEGGDNAGHGCSLTIYDYPGKSVSLSVSPFDDDGRVLSLAQFSVIAEADPHIATAVTALSASGAGLTASVTMTIDGDSKTSRTVAIGTSDGALEITVLDGFDRAFCRFPDYLNRRKAI